FMLPALLRRLSKPGFLTLADSMYGFIPPFEVEITSLGYELGSIGDSKIFRNEAVQQCPIATHSLEHVPVCVRGLGDLARRRVSQISDFLHESRRAFERLHGNAVHPALGGGLQIVDGGPDQGVAGLQVVV